MPGSLTSLNGESGFMSFLRLVGAAYFQTHRAAFRQHADPRSLFNSLKRDTQTPMEHHEMFIDKLRQSIWDRVVYEDNLIPSIDALRRHYLRAAWVLAYWKESKKEYMEPPPITLYGWKEADRKIQVDWESETNI